jgi:hypothetical protein
VDPCACQRAHPVGTRTRARSRPVEMTKHRNRTISRRSLCPGFPPAGQNRDPSV